MASLKDSKLAQLFIALSCIVFLAIGVVIGRFALGNPTYTPVQSNSSSSTIPFSVPQIPLPSDWSTKTNLPGNSFDTADTLNPGITTQGTLNQNNAIDYYMFTLKDAAQITIDVTNIPKSLYWVLYDDKQNEIASTYRVGTSEGSTKVAIQNPGKYYIKVWADYGQLTNYPYAIRLSILPFFE